MSISHRFFMDTAVSRHALRDTIVQAGIGLDATPDWKNVSTAVSVATNLSILEKQDNRPDNGVVPTRTIIFGDRNSYLSKPETEGQFERQSLLGILALLKAYPAANAYWLAYDAELPILLRRGGHLVLGQALTEYNRYWDAERQPYLAMVDLPYTIEPLGPWPYVRVK